MLNDIAIYRRGPPNAGIKFRWGRQRSRFWAYICDRPVVVNRVGPRPPSCKLWHIAGSKWRCWLPEKTMKCLWEEASTLHQRQQNSAFLTACSDKSVAYVTNNKRLYSTFCTVEANYWQRWSIVWPLSDSRATCLSFLVQPIIPFIFPGFICNPFLFIPVSILWSYLADCIYFLPTRSDHLHAITLMVNRPVTSY